MHRVTLFFQHWWTALLLMAVIFLASSQPKGVLPDYGASDWLVKKSGHLVLYGALAWTYLRGLTSGSRPLTWRLAALAVVMAGLYGATDEYHQSFVAGRGATVTDVGIDTLGATLGAMLTAAWQRRQARPQIKNFRGS